MQDEVRQDPNQVKFQKQVEEYISYVVADEDNIGLLGYQPNLRNVREAYKSGFINPEELTTVVSAIVTRYECHNGKSLWMGEGQQFKSPTHFFQYMFPNANQEVEAKPELSSAEQADTIKELMEKHNPKKTNYASKFKAKAKRKKKQEVKIDVSALPAHLQKWAK